MSYKTDDLGRLTEEELARFRINFSRCVIGMEPKIAYNPDTSFKGLCKSPSRIDVFLLLDQYCTDGNYQKALEEVGENDKPKEEVKGAVNAGKYSAEGVNWNPHPEIEFSHAVTDGSDEALDAMIELIWKKYDANENGKLHLQEAKPYIKKYLADEMEMPNA